MATYYVRPDGSNANSGTGQASNQAWQTITYALANMVLTNGVNYLYVSAGTYRELPTVSITPSSTQTLEIIGDPTSSLFSNVTPGIVRITNFLNDNIVPSEATVFTCAKTYVTLKNLSFHMYGNAIFTNASNLVFEKCTFENGNNPPNRNLGSLRIVSNGNNSINATISKCVFYGGYALYIVGPTTGANFDFNVDITNCLFQGEIGVLVDGPVIYNNTVGNGVSVFNSTFASLYGIFINSTTASNASDVKNSLFVFPFTGGTGCRAYTTGALVENYNRFAVSSARLNVTTGANSITGTAGIDYSESTINGLVPVAIYAPYTSSPLIGSGTSTGSPLTDIYSNQWTIGTDVGAFARTSFASTSFYYPTERNASTITIAPGSTSQSIELYLGSTGLTASTTGLSARYNRTRTASVSIPLVARTIAQAWTAGGFAEVDATNMPGVYRLDLPDAALASGADDVTIVVRGASGTNGAVLTVKLSSGGLTSAQTASAVWGASPAGYNDATTLGGVLNETRSVVGSTETLVQAIPQSVWDEPKSSHTTSGTFGDYLDAKVSTVADAARIQLRQGPFLIKQNATEGLITEVNQFLSTVPNMEMVLIDSSGGAVSVSGSTLVLRVRNQAGTAVVNNVTPTVAYADGGVIRWSPNLSWNALGVTTAGTYRIVVERTMSSVTTTFGPFLVQLSSG